MSNSLIRRPRAWLYLETLEDRVVPASTFQITDAPTESSSEPSINGDGTLIAFSSTGNFTGANADNSVEIFLFDAVTAQFRQLTNTDGSGLFGNSTSPSINFDGRRIAFTSNSDLIPGQNTDGSQEIFLFDVFTGLTQITNSVENSFNPSISGDGGRIVFQSRSDLVPPQNTDGSQEIFLFDDDNGLTQLTNAVIGNSFSPSINGDGSRITFDSTSDLTGDNADGSREVFLFDSESGLIQITDGAQTSASISSGNISRNGRKIAFHSNANLTGQNGDGSEEIFLFDSAEGSIRQLTDAPNGISLHPSVNADGTRIAFDSTSNPTGRNADNSREVFLHDTLDRNKPVVISGTQVDPTAVAFEPFPGFSGEVRTATGDVNGDGVQDIITTVGPGGGPHVKAFDGATGGVLLDFFAFNPAFAGGVYVSVGDINNDGFDDIITGAGPGGGPHVKVFDGQSGAEIRSFFAYNPVFGGGVRVTNGDTNGDGFAEIITGVGPGGGPHVKVFDGLLGAETASFFAFAPSFLGGVFVAAGDLNRDGLADIVVGADAGGGPQVRAFSGLDPTVELGNFFAFDPAFTGGVRVGVKDVDGNVVPEILAGAGPGGPPIIRFFDPATFEEIDSFLAFDAAFTDGVFVDGA